MQNYNDYSREASRFLLKRFLSLSYYRIVSDKPGYSQGWTLSDIASAIGITKANISNCNTGKSALSLASFIKLCGLFENTFGNTELLNCMSDMFLYLEAL